MMGTQMRTLLRVGTTGSEIGFIDFLSMTRACYWFRLRQPSEAGRQRNNSPMSHEDSTETTACSRLRVPRRKSIIVSPQVGRGICSKRPHGRHASVREAIPDG